MQVVYRSRKYQGIISGNNVLYHLIPCIIGENNVQFVKIAPKQYKELMQEYKINGPLTALKYETTLAAFNKQNKNKIIRVSTIDYNLHEHGTLVCQTTNKKSVLHFRDTLNQEESTFYLFDTSISLSDFELPDNLIVLFRTYPWPYTNFYLKKNNFNVTNIYWQRFDQKLYKIQW